MESNNEPEWKHKAVDKKWTSTIQFLGLYKILIEQIQMSTTSVAHVCTACSFDIILV